nr:MAG TPA: Rubrerythrin, rubrerythrin, peroxidase, peroxide, oxidized [Caudoviricetes sp.]
MISDEERREVARRLRALDHVVTKRDTIESGVNKFIKAVYGDRPYSPIECSTRNLCGLAMTLADLIEPQERTCKIEGTYDDEYGIYDHLTCGHVAMRQWPEPTRYCPSCGAEVVE